MELELIFVTGLSGSGKSVAVAALEDMGFFCADNMPPDLIPTFVKLILESRDMRRKVAVVSDIRVGESAFQSLFSALQQLDKLSCPYKLLFMDASDEVLCQRFKETRRRHPLLEQHDGSVQNAVRAERAMLLQARQIANYVIDTSYITAAQCKARVTELFAMEPGQRMRIRCMSFGNKYGTPYDADLVFDVRCLPNPFYVPHLKHKTGLEEPIRDFVMQYKQTQTLLAKLYDLLDFLVPLYQEEGKSQLVIAFGCTGGKQRSVVLCENIQAHLAQKGFLVSTSHRDIQK